MKVGYRDDPPKEPSKYDYDFDIAKDLFTENTGNWTYLIFVVIGISGIIGAFILWDIFG